MKTKFYTLMGLLLVFLLGAYYNYANRQPAAKSYEESNLVASSVINGSGRYIRRFCTSGWAPERADKKLDYGMYEVTTFPVGEASKEHKIAAQLMVSNVKKSVVENGWLDIKKAKADGYDFMYKDKIHMVNKKFLYDGVETDPQKPEFLMFYDTQHGPMLMGIMFVSPNGGEQFGGPDSVWHYHVEQGVCYEKGILPIGQVNEQGLCENGVVRQKSPEMLHLWLFEHPEGRFSTRMRLTQEQFEQAVKEVSLLYKKEGFLSR